MLPTYEDIMLPFLKYCNDEKEHTLSELRDFIPIHFKLTDSETRELTPSGRQTIISNRIGWARTYLKKAHLLSSPKRALYRITKRGQELLADNPVRISSKSLERYPEFVDFKYTSREKATDKQKVTEELPTYADKTPDEALESAYQQLKSELSKEVLDIIKSCTPAFFERLVVDLLISMGYGGSRRDAGKAIGASNDGGIDGTINEDKLGLDVIYLQAKRWENVVPTKEIRDFTGALASKKAKKGVFITTSHFPKSAYEFVEQVEYKIILIDGERLVDLMIENSVGLSTINTYEVKQIDSDYFEEQ